MSLASANKANLACTFCHDTKNIIVDYCRGDLVCGSCGYVLEGHCLDDGAEWRSFAPESASKERTVDRATHKSNSYFDDSLGGTGICGGDRAMIQAQRALQTHDNRGDIQLKKAFQHVTKIASNLSVGKDTSELDEAFSICKQLNCMKFLSTQYRITSANMAAVVYTACRRLRVGRSLNEIAKANEALDPKLDKQSIGKAFFKLQKLLTLQVEKIVPSPEETFPSKRKLEPEEYTIKIVKNEISHCRAAAWEDFLPRFCSKLDLELSLSKPAAELAEKTRLYGITGGKSRHCVGAVCLFLSAIILQNTELTLRDVSLATQQREQLLKSCFRMIVPHLERLLPADEEHEIGLERLQRSLVIRGHIHDQDTDVQI